MLTGKFVSLHISKKTAHVMEAEVNRGMIRVLNAFAIRNFERFFSNDKVINMALMVDNITMSMTSNGITATRVMITFDDMFPTSFSIDPVSSYDKKKGGLGALFKKDKKQDSDSAVDPDTASGATIKHKHTWGQYITQDEQGEAVSVTMGERDMIESLGECFYSHGYKVISIEAPDTSLIYSKNTIEFNYDNLNKIILHAENEEVGDLYVMTKDVPSTVKRIQFDGVIGDTFEEKIIDLCEKEMQGAQMRNPLVFLLGAAVGKTTEDYISLMDEFESRDMHVMDVYGVKDNTLYASNAIQIQIADELKKEINFIPCEYGICMCMFLRCYDNNAENMYEGQKTSTFTAENKLKVIKAVKIICAIALAVNVILTGIEVYEHLSLAGLIDDSGSLESQLNKVTAERSIADSQVSALKTIDTRLDDVFTFVLENVDSTMNIASIDTVDMLGESTGSFSTYTTTPAPTTTEGETAEGGEAEAVVEDTPKLTITEKELVIRGYSTKSSGPINLYNDLNNAGIGEVKLVGHQQMTLPTGEIIYAFELRAGQGDKLA